MVSLRGEAGLEVVKVCLQDQEVGPEVAVADFFQDELVPVTGEGDHNFKSDEALEVEFNSGGVQL